MIPQSIMDMINEATKTAYILTTLEYIKAECESHPEEYDEDDTPISCWKCPFYSKDEDSCFFHVGMVEAKIPSEWDLKELERRLQNDKR